MTLASNTGRIHRRTLRIEFAQCDPAGIVYFPRYFEMLDGCTNGAIEAVGYKKRAVLVNFGIAGIPAVDVRASFRADDVINVRGIKFFPSQIEEVVRAAPEMGDEYEIVLATNQDGLDVMTLRVEHASFQNSASLVETLERDVRSRCEIRATVEVLRPGTLAKTETKAKRVSDLRSK